MKLISIVIPVYNVEKYISRCLDSILSQTIQNFEIILIIDASPDNSRAIAERYAAADKRIRIIDNDKNSGAAWSRMVGYSNAEGEYIAFCDPDDYIPEDALETLYNEMIKDDDIDICMGDLQRVDSNGDMGKVFENHLRYGTDKFSVAESVLKHEAKHFLVCKLYKKEVFFKSNLITYKNFSKSSDEFLFFQVLQNCNKITNINKVLYYYFDNKESASYNKSNPDAMNAMLISLNYIEHTYKDNEDFKEVLHKWKTGKYAHFLKIADNDKELLRLLLDNNIDYLFTPLNLLRNFHKSKALSVFLIYIKARAKMFLSF